MGIAACRGVFIGLAAVVLTSLPSVGCGSPAPTTSPVPASHPVDAKEVLLQAVDEILELETASFTLEHLRGTTALIPGFLEMKKVYGVADIPGKFRLKVEAETVLPRSYVEVDIITIDDQAYMTDPITGEWGKVEPEVLPFRLTNLGQTLAEIIMAVESPTVVGVERVNGFDTQRLQGRIRSQVLGGLVPGAGEGFEVKLDLWLEHPGGLLLQVLISGKVIPTDAADTLRRLTLDDINAPVVITPPE